MIVEPLVFKVCPLPITDLTYSFLYAFELQSSILPINTVWRKGRIGVNTQTGNLEERLKDFARSQAETDLQPLYEHMNGSDTFHTDLIVEWHHIVKQD